MMFSMTLQSRDFTRPLPLPPLAWTVERLEWRAVGGPWTARLRARAPHINSLWQLAEALRCGVTISDRRGPAWWGCLTAVTIHAAGQAARVSLDGLTNRVALTYPAGPSTAWPGAGARPGWARTEWTGDPASLGLYGEKQGLFVTNLGGSPAADAYAHMILAQAARPALTAGPDDSPAEPGPYAVIEARGWWDTLDWRYYAEPRGAAGHPSGGSVAVSVGAGPTAAAAAQPFTPAGGEGWTAAEVWVKLRRGRAADGLRLDLCAGTAAAPSGPPLATAALSAAELSEDLAWTRFPCAPAVMLQPGVTYWLVLNRTGPLDPAAGAQMAVDEAAPPGEPGLCLWNGTAWVPRAPAGVLHYQVLGVEETTTQIARMLAPEAGGQFLRGLRIEQASAIPAPLVRDGARRARAEVEDLLRLGAGGDQPTRLLARVEPDRTARVYAQPAAPGPVPAALALAPGREIRRADGQALAPGEWPAGQWAGLGRLAPPGGKSAAVFIEACAWEDGRMRQMEHGG